VLLDIRRRFEQEKTNEAGRIYSFDVTLYKWPKLGWVWLTCLGLAILAILALAVSAIAVELRLTRLAKELDEWRKEYQKLQGQYDKLVSASTTLHESYREAQVISEFTEKLRNIADKAEKAKADDRAQVAMELRYRVNDKVPELGEIKRRAEEWRKFCDFLDKCAEFFKVKDKPQEPAKQGEGQ
jgi:capsid portal protein